MKKTSKILGIALSAMLVISGTACGGDETNSGGGTTGGGLQLMETGGRPVAFEYLEAGFGEDPYIAIANAFMEKHPDVQIQLIKNREIKSTTALNLSSNSGVSDIYSYPDGGALKTWIVDGYVEDLSELCARQTLDGRTVMDSMTGSAAEAISANGKTYAIPEYINVSGFVYNKDLFQQYGWEIPQTTKDLKDLCDKILADTNNTVTPITWCKDAGGYLYFATENWISQYEGVENMDKFYEYTSAEIYALEDNEVGALYTAKKEALQNLIKFFLPISEGGYAANNSRETTNTKAQLAVMDGECAMMLNGSWFQNEMKLYWEKDNIGMFAVPELADASGNVLRAADNAETKRTLTADYGAYYFIPTMAKNKTDAMDFLVYLSSEEACSIYTQYSNAIRPFQYSVGKSSELYSKVSVFGKSVLDMADEHTLYAPVSNSVLDLKNKAGLWPRGNRPEEEVTKKNGISAMEVLNKDYTFALDNWDDWMNLVS